MRPSHVIVLIVIMLIIFGAPKLPEVMRQLGRSAKVLKEEIRDLGETETTAQPHPHHCDCHDRPHHQTY